MKRKNRVNSVSVKEPTTHILVENVLLLFTLHKSSNICNERTGPISRQICFLYFFEEFILQAPRQPHATKIKILKLQTVGVKLCLLKIRAFNKIFLSLQNCCIFFPPFTQLKTICTSKVLTFFPYLRKNRLWGCASKM